jgi:hypothetical protein
MAEPLRSHELDRAGMAGRTWPRPVLKVNRGAGNSGAPRLIAPAQ